MSDSPAKTAGTHVSTPLTRAAERRGLIAMFGSTGFELTAVFMFGPLLLFTLKGRGIDTAAVALFSAAQWLGMALAAPFTSAWVSRIGLRRALIASGAVPVATMLLITLTPWVWLWALASIVGGVAASLRWIVAEATVAELAGNARRGRVVGLFEAMVGLTFMLGPALLAVLGTEGRAAEQARWVAIGLAAVGLLWSFLVPRLVHHAHGASRLGWHGIWDALRAAPVVMVAGFVGGFFEAGLSGVLPLYGLALGFTAALSALLAAASGLGSSLMMVPAGELADRWSLRGVLLGCATVNLIGCLLLPFVPLLGGLAWLIAFAWGGAGGALYTLAMVEIGHRHQGVALVNATAVLVLSYTVGGMLAPVLAGSALQWQPQWGFPLVLSCVGLAGLGAAWRLRPGSGPAQRRA
ncbi:MAG: MFS transporter [Burkholderiales bacterium]